MDDLIQQGEWAYLPIMCEITNKKRIYKKYTIFLHFVFLVDGLLAEGLLDKRTPGSDTRRSYKGLLNFSYNTLIIEFYSYY